MWMELCVLCSCVARLPKLTIIWNQKFNSLSFGSSLPPRLNESAPVSMQQDRTQNSIASSQSVTLSFSLQIIIYLPYFRKITQKQMCVWHTYDLLLLSSLHVLRFLSVWNTRNSINLKHFAVNDAKINIISKYHTQAIQQLLLFSSICSLNLFIVFSPAGGYLVEPVFPTFSKGIKISVIYE